MYPAASRQLAPQPTRRHVVSGYSLAASGGFERKVATSKAR